MEHKSNSENIFSEIIWSRIPIPHLSVLSWDIFTSQLFLSAMLHFCTLYGGAWVFWDHYIGINYRTLNNYRNNWLEPNLRLYWNCSPSFFLAGIYLFIFLLHCSHYSLNATTIKLQWSVNRLYIWSKLCVQKMLHSIQSQIEFDMNTHI